MSPAYPRNDQTYDFVAFAAAATASVSGTRKVAKALGPRMRAVRVAASLTAASSAAVYVIACHSTSETEDTEPSRLIRAVKPTYVEVQLRAVELSDVVRAVERHPYQMAGTLGVPVVAAVAAYHMSRPALSLYERVSRASVFGQLAMVTLLLGTMVVRDRAMARDRSRKELADAKARAERFSAEQYESTTTSAAPLAPNALLGTCFDEAWVQSVESALSISSTDRGYGGDKVNPFLHKALEQPRFWLSDPRTEVSMNELYQSDCLAAGSVVFGIGATLDDDGNVVDPGRVNGSIIIEHMAFASPSLSSMVFSILAQELLGYEVSMIQSADLSNIAERMSTHGDGQCAPTHITLEIRVDGGESQFDEYADETYSSAGIGYYGRSGLYTMASLVEDGASSSPAFSPDFWRDYQDNDDLISQLAVSVLKNNADFYPPASSGCPDGILACEDSCSKTTICTTRESGGGECLVVIMAQWFIDAGYIQSVFENLDIPAYFCFLGLDGKDKYVRYALENGIPLLFHHYEPEMDHARFDGQIQRVQLPFMTPQLAAENTGKFGNGEVNPVKVDFPLIQLDKYSTTLVQTSPPIESLLNRFSIPQLHIDKLMENYIVAEALNDPSLNLYFSAACSWLKVPTHYTIWSKWLEPLSDCSLAEHISYTVDGCSDNRTTNEDFPRVINFHWKMPDPRNTSLPYNCDGEWTSLPASIPTSQSCAWLENHYSTWISWVTTPPACTENHYSYSVSDCNQNGFMREVEYFWLLEDPENESASIECVGGVSLPDPVYLACEYVPNGRAQVIVMFAFSVALIVLLLVGGVYIVRNRHQPIIKRSQYQFLLTMMIGGVCMYVVMYAYGGRPHSASCTARPIVLSYGFTLIFGSLMVKSLRVYRVFMKSAMKRVVLSAKTMFKILFVFLLIDSLLLALWFTVDPITPQSTPTEVSTVSGVITVSIQKCGSSSVVFSVLIFFWKAILLFSGLRLSFLIRKVSSDFQESTWIFSSSLVVLFTSVIVLAMGYMIEMDPLAFYSFFAFLLLSATSVVMGLMIMPKLLRHRQNATGTLPSDRSSSGDTSSNNMQSVLPGAEKLNYRNSFKSLSFLTRQLSKKAPATVVRVTPVQQFSGRSDASSNAHARTTGPSDPSKSHQHSSKVSATSKQPASTTTDD